MDFRYNGLRPVDTYARVIIGMHTIGDWCHLIATVKILFAEIWHVNTAYHDSREESWASDKCLTPLGRRRCQWKLAESYAGKGRPAVDG